MATAAKSITVEFVKERETKGTWRYQEVPPENAEAVIGTLYVRKFALADVGVPERFTVTITPK